MEDFDVATIAITSVAPHGTSGAQWSLTLRIVPIPAEDPSQSDPPATADPDGRQRGEVDSDPEQPGAEAPTLTQTLTLTLILTLTRTGTRTRTRTL